MTTTPTTTTATTGPDDDGGDDGPSDDGPTMWARATEPNAPTTVALMTGGAATVAAETMVRAGPGGGRTGGSGRSWVGRRGGLRLLAGLLTVMGADQRPGEMLGWGPVHAELVGDLARSLPSWWCVLTGADGAPRAVVPIRRRPPPAPGTATTTTPPPPPGIGGWVSAG